LGGLTGFGPDCNAAFRRAGAYYVDRILRGTKPADLPVEQSTTFELVVNRFTAHALGITIPPTIVAQVTEWVDLSRARLETVRAPQSARTMAMQARRTTSVRPPAVAFEAPLPGALRVGTQ
jgi:hypothetical protein